jgi:hypothetical protein
MADLAKTKLAEELLGDVKPGDLQEAKLTFKFDAKRTPRIYAAVQGKEEDGWPADNVWGLSFTAGESSEPTPLLGTDIPNVFGAPQLLSYVNLPNIPSLQDLVNLPDFSSLTGLGNLQLPDLKGIGDVLKGQFQGIGIEKPDLGNLGGLLRR